MNTVKNLYTFWLSILLTLAGQAQNITCSVSSLPAFGNCLVFWSSSAQKYSVSATGLSSNLQITAPTGFEISLNCNQQYSASLSLSPVSGTIAATTVFVRFSPSATGSFSANLSHGSAGATTKTISLGGTGVNWNVPSNYYSTATGSGFTLKTNLYNKISSGTSALSYGGLWTAFASTDMGYNGKIWDIYSTSVCGTSPYTFTYSTNQCGNYSNEGDCYNREHSVPQDWFNGATPMYTDLFHLYPTDGKVNGMRSNYPYGQVSSPTWTSQLGAKLGPNSSSGYSGTVFEPVDEYKGDLARTYFYMATRYQNVIGGWYANSTQADAIFIANNTTSVYETWYLNLMLAWHNQDPVSMKEINRNNANYAQQGNRNPFIDSPQWVSKIWGGALAFKPTLASANLSFSNKTSTTMQLNWQSGNGNKRIVVMRAGSAINAIPQDSVYYVAHTTFGNGAQLGNGNFVVYNGSGSSVTVSGLTQNVTYFVSIFEYNGWYGSSNYQSSGALSGNTVLPVSWMSFDAKRSDKNTIELEWQTAAEINNDYFEVERFIDHSPWSVLGQVKGNGTTNTLSNYRFADNVSGFSTTANVVCYRLRQVDVDGSFHYSPVVVVQLSPDEQLLSLYPNPFSNSITLNGLSGNAENNKIELQDVYGKLVYTAFFSFQHGSSNDITLNLSHLPQGIYFLRTDIQVFKLMKE